LATSTAEMLMVFTPQLLSASGMSMLLSIVDDAGAGDWLLWSCAKQKEARRNRSGGPFA
jgi:hypothetical protein